MRFKSDKKVQPELVAAKDASRPVLNTVHLNAEKSEVWVTDSYMAARFPIELDEGDTSGPIPIDALKASRKSPMKYGTTSIALNGDAQVRVCDSDGSNPASPYLTVPRGAGEYTFPNLSELFPENIAEFEIGIDAGKLYKLAKAMGDERVRIRFTMGGDGEPSNLRPFHVRPLGATDNDASAILMPIRI